MQLSLADHFVMLSEADGPPPDVFEFLRAHPDVPPRECADILLIDQHHRWQTGENLPVEEYLRAFPAVAAVPELKLDLVFSELRNTARSSGEAPDIDQFIARFPELGDDLIRQFEVAEWLESMAGSSLKSSSLESVVDRDQALASLAVRMDLLSRETLNSVRGNLDSHETGALVQALLDRGILTARQHDLLRELTDELLNQKTSRRRTAASTGESPDSEASTITFDPSSSWRARREMIRAALGPPLDRPPDEGRAGGGQEQAVPPPSATVSGTATEPRPEGSAIVVANLEIIERLGEGAMGIVFRARQATLDRVVALKIIHARARTDPNLMTRFRTEVQAVARLSHPNFVQIYDISERDGLPCFLMEYVNGGSLARKLSSGPLPVRQAAQLVETLAGAMHIAHEHDIVHRDLKPANILLTLDGQPKITDFGLAKIRSGQENGSAPGGAADAPGGAIVGTPSYMAPEQAQGQDSGPACDIYALGATLYEMLTGRPPFRAATVYGTLVQVIHEAPVPPGRLRPKLPRDLELICLKCLEKDPQRRYHTAELLAEDLHAFLSGEPIQGHEAPRADPFLRWSRRKPSPAVLIGGAALATGGIMLGVWLSSPLLIGAIASLGLVAGGVWYHTRFLAVLREVTQQQILTERYAERLQMLGEMSRQLMAVTDLDKLLYLLSETAARLANAELATIYIVDRERKEVWSKVKLGLDIGEIRVPLGTGIAGHVASTGEMINLSDPYADPRFNSAIDRQTGHRTRNLLTLPMIARGGQVIGVFQVLNKRRGTFEAEDEEVLCSLAATAAVIIERARPRR